MESCCAYFHPEQSEMLDNKAIWLGLGIEMSGLSLGTKPTR